MKTLTLRDLTTEDIMKKICFTVVLVLVFCLISACGPSEADLAETEEVISQTEDAQSTETKSARQTSESATQQFQTQVANTAQAGTEKASAAQAATAEAGTATAAFQSTRTSARATQQQSTIVAQTEEAANIYGVIQALYEAGHITRTSGYFQPLPPFEYSLAQIFWLQNVTIPDTRVRDFVAVMNVSWESASRTAEFYGSGCGISFRGDENFSEYYSYMLTLDGNITFFPALSSSNTVRFSKAWFGTLDHMEGSETFIVVADGTTYKVFNEQLERIDLRYGEELREGNLAYVISSGTNVDFGTRCSFYDGALWHFDD
jgi:hypothetical protein